MNKLALLMAFLLTGATTVSTFVFAQTSQSPPPAVPVAQPKVTEKIEKSDPKAEKPQLPKTGKEESLLPGKFIKNIVESMPSSSAGYIPLNGMRVDTSRRCWLYPYQIYGKKDDRHVVLVTKDEEGSLHVVLEGINHQWEAVDFDTTGWLAVKTVRDSGSSTKR